MKLRPVLLLLLFPLFAAAQPRFVPDVEIVKVGEVKFQTPKRVTFGFANKGDEPLQIRSVQPSCGCLDVVWPSQPIAGGERGEIQVTYDARMMGTFYKDLLVATNASPEPVRLALQGCVVSEVRDYSAQYPVDLGNVRLDTNYVEFGDVSLGEHPCADLHLVNMENTAFRPELMHLPAYIIPHYIPETIPAGQSGTIRLELASDKLPALGLHQTRIYLARYLGDKVGEANEIQLSAVLLPDFSSLTPEERAQGPRLALLPAEADSSGVALSPVRKGRQYAEVDIENRGESVLEIRQVQVFNEALSISLGNRTVKPGRRTKLKLTLHPEKFRHTKTRPCVLLITNDPEHTKETIYIIDH
ncbi:MAG: DUF1573 domain-containing protein [Bacteroidaceae bacterium]|nr:DUF1573 domain-containing protein [Bacteroidaceae bacterium]